MVKRPIFLGLLLLAAAALMSALWVSGQWQPSDNDETGIGTPLIPGLSDRINEISDLTLVSDGEQVQLSRQGEQWVVTQRDGYPADMKKLRSVLIALSDSIRLEAKTANPERFARLGLHDQAAAESGDALSMAITDSTGQTTVLFGHRLEASTEPRQYARIVGESGSWLVSGRFQYDTEPSRWLNQTIIDLPAPQVIRVRISHPDGQELNLSKADAAQPNFDVDNLPEGRQLLAPTSGNSIASALGSLMLTDVRASTMPLPEDVTVAEYTRTDGLTITVRAWSESDEYWITLSARADASAALSDQNEPDEQALEQQADEINQRVSGWSYRIPSYKHANMTKTLDELLKPVSDG